MTRRYRLFVGGRGGEHHALRLPADRLDDWRVLGQTELYQLVDRLRDSEDDPLFHGTGHHVVIAGTHLDERPQAYLLDEANDRVVLRRGWFRRCRREVNGFSDEHVAPGEWWLIANLLEKSGSVFEIETVAPFDPALLVLNVDRFLETPVLGDVRYDGMCLEPELDYYFDKGFDVRIVQAEDGAE